MRSALTVEESSFEQAVGVVRLVLGVLGTVLCGAASVPPVRSGDTTAALLPVIVVVVGAAWGLLTWWLDRETTASGPDVNSRGRSGLGVGVHVGDTLVCLGLVVALGGVAANTGWVILVVPVVVAGVRFGSRTVIGTWLGGSVGLALATWVWPDRFDAGPQVVIERSGMLLVVAAAVALLARWLEEGWRTQAELTQEAERSRDRLDVIQSASRSMRGAASSDILRITASYGVPVGFDACVVTAETKTVEVAGDGGFIPIDAQFTTPQVGVVELTQWVHPELGSCFSASVFEPVSGAVVTGWSRSPINQAQAESLAHLIAHAGPAIEAAQHLERARFEASHDPLTLVANRKAIHDFLQASFTSGGHLGAIFIDLDHFKAVNDTHGHAVGDQLLRSIAQRIEAAAGKGMLTGRYGGDEFVVLGELDDSDTFIKIGADIGTSLAVPHALGGIEVSSTVSIGVAHTIGADRDELIERADQAAYEAKAGGRNRMVVWRPQTSTPQPSAIGPTGRL